jgi:hypothetical protein
MTEENETDQERSSTSPPEGDTGHATTPPANPDVDQDAVDRGQEKLDQAAGDH